MMPRRVRLAVLLAFVGHGLFILTGRYRLSYDAYTHMLFANHYAENWFSLWETRWYTGFPVISYPPLVHQWIGLFIPFFGFDRAFALVLWIVTSLYPLGIYAFSRIFTARTAAAYAALVSALLLPIYVTAHIFGQLPFLASTLVALFAAASLNRYLHEGGIHNFTLSVSLLTTSVAMHHATLMVQPFLILAVVVHAFFSIERSGETWQRQLIRLVSFGLSSVITSFLVIFPFWQWGAAQTMQTPIDHLSRHNFFTDRLALSIFFFPLYGPLIVIVPFLFRKWHRHFWGLLFSFTLLFLLGLGGTTPLPRIFFGVAWEWLTYDRFAFWACLTLTPFFGIFWIELKRRWKVRSLTKPVPLTLRRSFLAALVFSVFTLTALGAWLTPLLFPSQPKTIDMQPIVHFLNENNNSQWRYLTLGFGDQFAYLNLLTHATTIDGSYHTARTLPEQRDSGVGQVDTAYWALNGMNLIKPILQKSGERAVRWVFVNPKTLEAISLRWGKIHRSPFLPLLEELGWHKIETLPNGILVFENPNAKALPLNPRPQFPLFTSFAWGVFPLLSFVTSITLSALRVYPIQAAWVIRKTYAFVISLIPLALSFWIYRRIGDFSHPRVYFTYDNALFFLSDALVLLAVILWLAVKISQASSKADIPLEITSVPSLVLAAFILLTTLSILWSRDWHTSLYISLHFCMIFLFILSLRDWYESWNVAIFGLCAALGIQLIAGFVEFGLQSTAFLQSFRLMWPGILDPSLRGASVVQLANGLRVLRAYGTLPHPNILGGFILILLLGPTTLFLTDKKPNYLTLILLSLGMILLVLTFSRSAWLGTVAFTIILMMKSKYLGQRKLNLLLAIIGVTIVLTLFPLRGLLFTRVYDQAVTTEQISTGGRSWLARQAFDMVRKHPLTGVGVGSFVLELANNSLDGAPIEPVHNTILLLTAELGLLGGILLFALCFTVARIIIRSRSPQAILAGALVTGLGIINLFDHYFWTIAPGRVMLALALGLWAGQVAHDA
ncbi:MAG TPA: O-antigen ligase family protein [Anaerolineales bacterium]|nr:O-antigen ligase family protein [Anaerolineales bacterium]